MSKMEKNKSMKICIYFSGSVSDLVRVSEESEVY